MTAILLKSVNSERSYWLEIVSYLQIKMFMPFRGDVKNWYV